MKSNEVQSDTFHAVRKGTQASALAPHVVEVQVPVNFGVVLKRMTAVYRVGS